MFTIFVAIACGVECIVDTTSNIMKTDELI